MIDFSVYAGVFRELLVGPTDLSERVGQICLRGLEGNSAIVCIAHDSMYGQKRSMKSTDDRQQDVDIVLLHTRSLQE